MERISLKEDRNAIILEHVHRYQLCKELVSGKVLDISCGIGYGSEILCTSSNLTSYIGVDISEPDITYAKSNYPSPNRTFLVGDITSLEFEDKSFDSIVCLETLEHIPNPEKAIIELSRVLKDDGVFICTVPEDSYDIKCEEVYGPNPYHLRKFSPADAEELIKTCFNNFKMLRVGVVFGTLTSSSGETTSKIINTDPKLPHGSLLFIAHKQENNKLNSQLNKISNLFVPALSMPEYDEENSAKLWHTINIQEELVYKLRETISKNELMIREKDNLISSQDKIIEDKTTCIKSLEKMIQERDLTIKSMEKMIVDRDDAIKSMEIMIQERDKTIKSMEEVIEKRWQIILDYERDLNRLRGEDNK